jgi:hypothetical protein
MVMSEYNEEFWWNVIVGILLANILFFTGLGVYATTKDHKVLRYYLVSRSTNHGDHELSIEGDVDWATNNILVLDRAISYKEAIELCDEMNKKLRK